VLLPNRPSGANPRLVGGNSLEPGALVTHFDKDQQANGTRQTDPWGRITRCTSNDACSKLGRTPIPTATFLRNDVLCIV